MQEIWEPIVDFPEYYVSDQGRVMNDRSGRIMILTRNQSGITMVGLFRDGKQFKRSVAILVARYFLPAPPNQYFDTPIHLDGDLGNNEAINLDWRPRWFAYQYHAQYREDYGNRLHSPIEVVQTGEVFANSLECAKSLGLIERDVVLATLNKGMAVFPSDFEFQIAQ